VVSSPTYVEYFFSLYGSRQVSSTDKAQSWPDAFGFHPLVRYAFALCHSLVRYGPVKVVALNSLLLAIVIRHRVMLCVCW
jgi:hypothetical protein